MIRTSALCMFVLGAATLPLAHVADAEGLPTGKRQHKPFTITKMVDEAAALDEMLMAVLDPPSGETEATLVITRSQDETAAASTGRTKYSNITLKRGLYASAWRFEVDGVATCKFDGSTLSDAAGQTLLVQIGDGIFVPGARTARYARTTAGVIDADGSVIAIAADDEPARHPLELVMLAATLDGFCR